MADVPWAQKLKQLIPEPELRGQIKAELLNRSEGDRLILFDDVDEAVKSALLRLVSGPPVSPDSDSTTSLDSPCTSEHATGSSAHAVDTCDEGSSSKRQKLGGVELHSGKNSVVKDAVIKMLRMAGVEYDLPRKYIEIMCKEFKVCPIGKHPKKVGNFGRRLGQKVEISETEYGVFKYMAGERARIYVKEVCMHIHLQDLEGTRIPKLLSYGSIDAPCIGCPSFFLLEEYYGDPLNPNEISSSEFGDLLREIHAHNIILCSPNSVFTEFPAVVRHGNTLALVDLCGASFNREAKLFQDNFDFLISFCKKDNDD